LLLGIVCSVFGVAILATLGAAPALIALVTILIYVLAYTPLKVISPLNTLVGAIPGALPPLIGFSAAWAAVGSTTAWSSLAALAQPGGWSLFGLMFVWQIPHVMALCWMYREDYAKGGYRMLPIVDPQGKATAMTMLAWAIALIPVTLVPVALNREALGIASAATAVFTGTVFVFLCVRLCRSRTNSRARAVFIGSIIHLPVLLLVMTGDALASRLL
jgi:heme O synthase-like polyprenyltransferase